MGTAEVNRLREGLDGLLGDLPPRPRPIDDELREVYEAAGAPDAWRLSGHATGHMATAAMRAEVVGFFEGVAVNTAICHHRRRDPVCLSTSQRCRNDVRRCMNPEKWVRSWVEFQEVCMARVDTEDLISISEANKLGVSALIREAEEGRDRIVLRNNKPVAVVMGVERFEQWQQLQDDLIDITLVAARMMTTSGPSYSLDEVLERFGYTREELAAMPD